MQSFKWLITDSIAMDSMIMSNTNNLTHNPIYNLIYKNNTTNSNNNNIMKNQRRLSWANLVFRNNCKGRIQPREVRKKKSKMSGMIQN